MNSGETPNSFSEPPLAIGMPPRITTGGQRPSHSMRPTFVDVAMRLVNDGPMYAVIALMGALAITGKATAPEMVITALGALLARSWPRAVQIGGAGAFFLVMGVRLAMASPATLPPIAVRPPSQVVAMKGSVVP